MSEMTFRFARQGDAPLVLKFIRALAEYEKMSDLVVADVQLLEEELFDHRHAEVIFAMEDGVEVGFALFFHNFSIRIFFRIKKAVAAFRQLLFSSVL